MTFELLCATMIALLFGTMVCFGGYRLFLALLPIWGFFFGFGLGAQTIQALFGDAFLSTVTSWVVGFITALIFAVLSYLFYSFAVAILAGSLGYAAGVALMGLFSADLTFITWLVGIVLGVILIGITFYFNLAKYMIIIATAVGGAGMTIGTLTLGVGGVQLMRLLDTPLKAMLDDSPLWTILFLIMAGMGIVAQIRVNRAIEIETYNRWATS
ncbi:MAG: DUF4203 domain-containing protein [Chloroflexi bacterium]|nr:DUF4203 domain-containing protein [Chloroflexota bacterium]MBP7043873.1 DUF4203 domain-containing protein [Chloroflexota bacterium]